MVISSILVISIVIDSDRGLVTRIKKNIYMMKIERVTCI